MLDRTFWLKYFEVYDYLNVLIPYKKLLHEICIRAELKKNYNILDLGSGTGNLSVESSKYGVKVSAIDFSKEGIEVHRSKQPQHNLVYGDISNKLPFQNNNFDVVLSNNVLYTISRKKRKLIFDEVYRVLKPDGVFVVSNIRKNFSPIMIYVEHVKDKIKVSGIIETFFSLIRLIVPTMKIFYYNHLINKENSLGSYDFFEDGEQAKNLNQAGFSFVSQDIDVYSNQAILNVARK